MEERFLHHANAVAFAGSIRRPFNEIIESQASSVLSINGGFGSARVENFRFRELASFRSASSTVAGNVSKSDGGNDVENGLATATVEGLNIGGVVTADVVVGRLVSRHAGRPDALPMLPVGSYFTNLRIAGFRIDPQPHDILFQSATLGEMDDACKKKPRRLPVDSGGQPIEIDHPTKPGSPEPRVLTSLFERPSTLPPGCFAKERHGWGIVVPGFGTVFLGEFLITRSSRRLTMIRVEMGSPVEGEFVSNVLEGNGSTYP
jgi:hypothetical protein